MSTDKVEFSPVFVSGVFVHGYASEIFHIISIFTNNVCKLFGFISLDDLVYVYSIKKGFMSGGSGN